MEDNIKKNTISIFKIFLGILVFSYFLWYFLGGPERWEEKLKNGLDEKAFQENIFGDGIKK